MTASENAKDKRSCFTQGEGVSRGIIDNVSSTKVFFN